MILRVRRMMLIAGLTTALGLGAVFVAIGYRVFKNDGSAQADHIAMLPKSARVVSTGASSGRITVTIDIGGTTEIRTFDVKTLKATGTLKFANEP